MRKPFTGVWAIYQYLDDFCESIRDLKSSGFETITTHTPCSLNEIEEALGYPQSRVPFFTLAGGILGFGIAVALMGYMALDWVLPVSAKPVVSIPTMGPIAFEISVLMAIFFTIAAMVLIGWRDTLAHPVPKSQKYKTYNRFMRDRFGLVICCKMDDLSKVESILKKHQAEEVVIES